MWRLAYLCTEPVDTVDTIDIEVQIYDDASACVTRDCDRLVPSELVRNADIVKYYKAAFDKLVKDSKLAPEPMATLVKAAGEAVHIGYVLQDMGGKSQLELFDDVLMAARITLAPFTVASDRTMVAKLDGYVITSNCPKNQTSVDGNGVCV